MATMKSNKIHWLLSFAIALVLSTLCFRSRFVAAASQKKESGSTAKQKKLSTLASRGPVVPLSSSNYTRYAEGSRSTRPYHLVMLFTSSAPEHKCMACRPAEAAFEKVARAHVHQQELKLTQGTVTDDDEALVFAVVDASIALNIFVQYQIASAPHVFIVPMGSNLPQGREKDEMDVTMSLTSGRGDSKTANFVSMIKRATGVEILILPDTSGLIPSAVVFGIVLGLMARIFIRVPSRILAALRNRGVWITASTACYMTGVGGMIYCIIRSPSLYGFDPQSGKSVIFSQGGRDQFWYEGVVVAFLNVAMACAIYGVYSAAGWKRVPSVVRSLAALACVTGLCYMTREYFKLYLKKTPWYSLEQMLPRSLLELYSGKLKRSHGLLKRLVRLSQLWLNEFTTMESFLEKGKTLLWDFLVRKAKSFAGFS